MVALGPSKVLPCARSIFFERADNKKRLDDTLSVLSIDKVLFDSRPLFSSSPRDESDQPTPQSYEQTQLDLF